MIEELPPVGVNLNLSKPSPARIYDYLLGGTANYDVDRVAADQVIAAYPDVRLVARANRAFLSRAVTYLAAEGVRQFLDLGAGLPTQGHVHDIARQIRPDARVVYVDNDPMACRHARALVDGNRNVAVIEADVRRPEEILTDHRCTTLIDWTEPVGLLMVALLHFVPDADEPRKLIRTFAERLIPGSHLVLSHSSGGLGEATDVQANNAFRPSATAAQDRTPDEIEAFFEGFDVVEPGLVDAWQWRAGRHSSVPRSRVRLLAGVGRKSCGAS